MTEENERRTPLPGENREGWMMFRHAGPINLFELTADQIDIRDIIHGLSRINRFNGQSAVPIPVLWHSLLVMELCASENRATRLEALFHDAGETYIGDFIRPIRSVMGQPLMRLRENIQETVFEAVGLPGHSAILWTPLHRADDTALRCEMASPWGYGRVASWHKTPSEAERRQVQNAIERIGCPPRNGIERERLEALFLEHADRLTGPEAPIRNSIEKARKG